MNPFPTAIPSSSPNLKDNSSAQPLLETVSTTMDRFCWSLGTSLEFPAASRAFFEANGYVIYEHAASKTDTALLRAAIQELVSDPSTTPSLQDGLEKAPVFTTQDQARAMDDRYFIESAATIRCFREERATDVAAASAPASESDPMLDNQDSLPAMAKRTAADSSLSSPQQQGGASQHDTNPTRASTTNKVGHALHDLHPVFARFSYSDCVRTVARIHGLKNPLLVQSMYIFKQPYIGGEVRPHRDATFIISEPDTCLGFWWALQESTEDNGCLWVVPGSHKDGVRKRFLRHPSKAYGTVFEGEEHVHYTKEEFVPLPMAEGDLVVLHGALMHMSLENYSPQSRHAYSIHLVDGPPVATYSQRAWLQRPADMPFRSLDNPPSFSC